MGGLSNSQKLGGNAPLAPPVRKYKAAERHQERSGLRRSFVASSCSSAGTQKHSPDTSQPGDAPESRLPFRAVQTRVFETCRGTTTSGWPSSAPYKAAGDGRPLLSSQAIAESAPGTGRPCRRCPTRYRPRSSAWEGLEARVVLRRRRTAGRAVLPSRVPAFPASRWPERYGHSRPARYSTGAGPCASRRRLGKVSLFLVAA